jgi:hypothetical protein
VNPNNNNNNNNNIDHIISAFSITAQEQYINRKDAGALTYTLPYARKQVELDNEHWYEHELKSVETSHEGKATILWNQQLTSDK